MNIEIPNEVYLKIKEDVLECYPEMTDGEIANFLVKFMSEDMFIKNFSGFVSYEERIKRFKNR